MTAGDEVIYVAEPELFWIGTIEAVLGNGKLLVTFPDGDPAVFDATELELHDVWAERVAA